MRVNIYAEELTDDVKIVVKDTGGKSYGGVRFNLLSSENLHFRPDDDDRSAVTFWGKPARLHKLFEQALKQLESELLIK